MVQATGTRVTLVIPAYEEAATIADLIARAKNYIGNIIVIDDGSSDDTAAQAYSESVTVIRNRTNIGKGASLSLGFKNGLASMPESIVTMDADGQHDPRDIPRLMAAARRYPDKIIIAARTKNRAAAPFLRRFANRFADFWISWAAGYPIQDSQSGYRLYPARILRELGMPYGHTNGFAFESELLIEAAHLGFYSESLSIETVYHPSGRRSHYRPAIDTLRIVRMVAWKLLCNGMYPRGLLRTLRLLPDPRYSDKLL